MVTTRPPKTIVKPTALGPVANTDTKLLIYGLFRKGRVLAQDGMLAAAEPIRTIRCGTPEAKSVPFLGNTHVLKTSQRASWAVLQLARS